MNRNNSPFRPARIIFTLLTALLSLPAWQGVMGQNSSGHSLLLCETGTIKSFGRNNICQLGLGSSTPSLYSSPQSIPGISRAVMVSAGHSHSLAVLDDGTVLAWGSNASGCAGQLYPATVQVCTPLQVDSLNGCAVAVAAGESFSLALFADGTVWAWGANNEGQLGNGAGNPSTNIPVQVTGITTAIAISAGRHHGMALLADGTVKTWGRGDEGQIGNGSSTTQYSPQTVVTASGTLTNVIAIDAGNMHNITLRSDHSVYTWGSNNTGALGVGVTPATSNVAIPSSLLADLSNGNNLDVAAGDGISMVLKASGITRVSGSNTNRGLGITTPTGNVFTPLAGPYFANGKSISIGSTAQHGFAVRATGLVNAWGYNIYGQTGVGYTSGYVAPPVQITTNCAITTNPDNHPQPCCVAVREDERVVIGTNGGTVTLTGTQTFTNLNMAIFGTVILNGNRTFSNCSVVMGKDAKIIVNSGRTLNIHTTSHFYACSDMWDGIVVNNNGRIYVQSGSIIEDAEVAVDLQYGAYYYLNNSTFNRNYIHVNKVMPPSGSPALTGDYRILKCKFLCHATPVVGGVHANLLPPRQSQRSYMGVQALGVPKILVGSTLANANTFENIDFGIYAEAVPRTSILYNNFRDHTVGARVEQGYATTTNNTIDFNNKVLRSRFGIICFDNDTTARIRITNNEIDYTGITSPTTFMTGITVSEITPASAHNTANFIDISNNNIKRAPCGISLVNLQGDLFTTDARLYVGLNTITHSKPDDNVQAGILLNNVTQAAIAQNTISSPTGYVHWAETGIRVSGGSANAFICDTIRNVGRGIWVDGDIRPNTDIINNTLDNNQTGLLLNWGYVGAQGSSGNPRDNQWKGSGWGPSNPNTLVLGTGVQGSQSPFWVRNFPIAPSVYIPQHNVLGGGASSVVTINTTTGTWTGGCVYTDGASFKTEGGESDAVQNLLAILEQDEPETERGQSIRWMGEYNLYRKLMTDEELQYADESLSTFHTERASGNMGRLHRAISGFNGARNVQSEEVTDGLSALQGVQPQNRVEQSLYDVLSLLYANATDLRTMNYDDVAQLRDIALRCPLDDGLAVHIARAALFTIDTLPKGYMNECELAPPYNGDSDKENKVVDAESFAVYPNPNNGRMTVSYALAEGETGILRVHNTVGVLVMEKPLNASQALMEVEMNGIGSGLYLLSIDVNNDRKLTERISVVR